MHAPDEVVRAYCAELENCLLSLVFKGITSPDRLTSSAIAIRRPVTKIPNPQQRKQDIESKWMGRKNW
ncbi:hypothetical protein Cob_v008728 [Colletotrichum orbiculare MAFF 240422]|uniref:Uncharacterized protein n=1 Tax=Colletotrichum orbiculare (strain 104-T / ATCC 96160 / CBS 514.97 / LARS 414 / MAFF 240422) TaxID=1213857 RepID=A0A484FK64_COLOR|nr:hypothetical protein Cob_v008728 [Colletotrichum orbiculare MAFF 240422]